jgi:hypothetical protein
MHAVEPTAVNIAYATKPTLRPETE